MTWTVKLSRQARKQIDHLPQRVREILITLMREIEIQGPVRGNWPNYGRLESSRHHCHLKKGKPTYVAKWEVRDKEVKLVEVIYAGTHEKAPY
ncbi:MAG TPA: cytotoxic translational repressor of toxin-antitoxin stability system [Syntrophales bacterium]|nr:cytotoxic translational repressor of toxin-antitoxin stability system [Syntrophales bacterium]